MLTFNSSAPPTGLGLHDVPGPLRLGVTGGIGSGKSTVARLLAVFGAPLYFADVRAKALMEAEGSVKESIQNLFGPESYGADGRLNRALLSARAFTDPSLTQALNAIVHPAVAQDYEDWARLPRPGVAYTVKEAAILFEAETYKRVYLVLHVSAPEEVRIARALARDPQRSRAQVENILRLQLPEAEREARSQILLHNSGAESLIQQAEELDRYLRSLSTDM